MPLYNVEHSYPLSPRQKEDLAERITHLHSTTFKTPSIFAQIKYHQTDASAHSFFIAGRHNDESVNRISAIVRSSPQRKKEDFDKLALDIENAWYTVLGLRSEDGEKNDKKKDDKEVSQKDRAAMELLSVAFIGAITGREKGMALPGVGEEGSWFKESRKDFEKRGELGDEAFKVMLEEIDTRDDLKSWRE